MMITMGELFAVVVFWIFWILAMYLITPKQEQGEAT